MREKTMEEKIHDLRKEIDRVIKLTQLLRLEIDRGNGGREISLAFTKLQEGKMWAGKVLEALGSKFPAKYRDEAQDKQDEAVTN